MSAIAEHQTGVIAYRPLEDVIQTGYTLSGKVLRYAKVVVGA